MSTRDSETLQNLTDLKRLNGVFLTGFMRSTGPDIFSGFAHYMLKLKCYNALSKMLISFHINSLFFLGILLIPIWRYSVLLRIITYYKN